VHWQHTLVQHLDIFAKWLKIAIGVRWKNKTYSLVSDQLQEYPPK
jgi:hypothetical protein